MPARLTRLGSRGWVIGQCAVAAGVAWLAARYVLGHTQPVFAPIAAVVGLGTSYGQRLRRVFEVTAGISLGVLVGDLLVNGIGRGSWQVALIVVLSMSVASLLSGSVLLVTQAAVQSIFVTVALPSRGAIWTRWTEALIGGGVALLAAAVVPAAALRRPGDQAARVVTKIGELLRAAADVLDGGPGDHGYAVLADARATDGLVTQLQAAAAEGMSLVVSSPFRGRHRAHVRRIAELVEPLDRALRSTRVLVRQVAVAAHRGRPVPASYASLARQLAEATDVVADSLRNDDLSAAVPLLHQVGARTGQLERSDVVNAEAILVLLRSIVVDLLVLCGVDQLDATDSLPPPGSAQLPV